MNDEIHAGTISHVCVERGFGFARFPGRGKPVFFHCRDLIDLEFGPALQELPITCRIVATEKGPTCVQVRAAENV